MPSGPVPQDPGRDEDPRPVPAWPEWMDDPAYLALRAAVLAENGTRRE